MSTQLDQTDSDAYESTMNEEGFIALGILDINLADDEEVKTVVCRLSCESGDSMEGSEAFLLADAVRLAPLD